MEKRGRVTVLVSQRSHREVGRTLSAAVLSTRELLVDRTLLARGISAALDTVVEARRVVEVAVHQHQGGPSRDDHSRLTFDYFVHNLMGVEVPGYAFTGCADPLANMRRRAVTFVPWAGRGTQGAGGD